MHSYTLPVLMHFTIHVYMFTMRCVLSCGGPRDISFEYYFFYCSFNNPITIHGKPGRDKIPLKKDALCQPWVSKVTYHWLPALSLFSSEHFAAIPQRVKKRKPLLQRPSLLPSLGQVLLHRSSETSIPSKNLSKAYYLEKEFMGTENVKVVSLIISYY